MRTCFSIYSLAVAVATMLSAVGSTALAAPSADRLTIGLAQEPDTLHPVISTMSVSFGIRSTVLFPLAMTNENLKWECWLCVTIPTIENGGAKIITENGKKKLAVTWEIRPDAKWGDGKPVTGHDMRLAWQVGNAPTVAKQSSDVFVAIEDVLVDAKNPRRFVLKYKETAYDYNQLDFSVIPIPAHIEGPIFERTKAVTEAYEKQTAYITNPTNPGLYNGGYRVAEIKPSSHVLVVRNEQFYGKPAPIKSLLFKIIPNTQALEANLLSGTIDMIGQIGMTFDQALALDKRLQADPALSKRFKIVYNEDLNYEHIDLNLLDPIVADLRVRRALMHGVDRDKMCQALFGGKQQAAPHPWHPLSPYFTTDTATYAFDPARAQALLEEAGWKKGPDGIRVKDGQRLSLQIMTTAGNKMRELVQVFLQQAWRGIGIELVIKNEPARIFFGETLHQLRYGQMAMYAQTLTNPADIQAAYLHSAQIPSKANGWAGSNNMSWRNAKSDALLDQAQNELDAGKRKVLIKGVIDEFTAELPQLPLYYRVNTVAVPTSLRPNQGSSNPYPVMLKAHLWQIDAATAH